MRTTEHPTREEWQARQSALPELAKASLLKIRAEMSSAEDMRRREAAARQAEADDWRAAFEAAVAGTLIANGCEWLAAYRVPDEVVLSLPDFTLASNSFFALFDPSAVGQQPTALRLLAATGHARHWFPDPTHPWKVYRPSGAAPFRDWPMAFICALDHTTPF